MSRKGWSDAGSAQEYCGCEGADRIRRARLPWWGNERFRERTNTGRRRPHGEEASSTLRDEPDRRAAGTSGPAAAQASVEEMTR